MLSGWLVGDRSASPSTVTRLAQLPFEAEVAVDAAIEVIVTTVTGSTSMKTTVESQREL